MGCGLPCARVEGAWGCRRQSAPAGIGTSGDQHCQGSVPAEWAVVLPARGAVVAAVGAGAGAARDPPWQRQQRAQGALRHRTWVQGQARGHMQTPTVAVCPGLSRGRAVSCFQHGCNSWVLRGSVRSPGSLPAVPPGTAAALAPQGRGRSSPTANLPRHPDAPGRCRGAGSCGGAHPARHSLWDRHGVSDAGPMASPPCCGTPAPLHPWVPCGWGLPVARGRPSSAQSR